MLIVFGLLRKLISIKSCLTCVGVALGAIGIFVALGILFATLSGSANVNNCFFYIICVNRPG